MAQAQLGLQIHPAGGDKTGGRVRVSLSILSEGSLHELTKQKWQPKREYVGQELQLSIWFSWLET